MHSRPNTVVNRVNWTTWVGKRKHTFSHNSLQSSCSESMTMTGLTQIYLALSLSQSEMKALNPSPSLLLSCQEQNTIITLTASAVAAIVSTALWGICLTATCGWGETVRDNMPVTLRIKEGTESFCLHLRFKDSLSVFSSFQVNLFVKQVCCFTWARALASATSHDQRVQGGKEADINNKCLWALLTELSMRSMRFKPGRFSMLLHNVKTGLDWFRHTPPLTVIWVQAVKLWSVINTTMVLPLSGL